MRIDVVPIFPEYLDPLRQALLRAAPRHGAPSPPSARGPLPLDVPDLRAWTHDVHKAVDDSPYGGGPGMVMKPQVWGEALDEGCAGGAPRPGVPPRAVRPPPGAPPLRAGRARGVRRGGLVGVGGGGVRGHRPARPRRPPPPH